MPAGADQLPWRGPGPGRPDLPLPPDRMALWRQGRLRKSWRYMAAYDERMMLCGARVKIGPFKQSFWALWDRETGVRHAHTSFLRGGDEVRFEGSKMLLRADGVDAELTFADSEPIESVCPSGEGGYAWTLKRAGMPVSGNVTVGGRRLMLEGARGVEDVSAGYHKRHTDWFWSAGVGFAADGRQVAWNLVTGINDPPAASERAIWIEGRPSEPDPVVFDGLDGIGFADGSRLDFDAESERARDDNLLVIRSRYRHIFGSFRGSLPGIELRGALGVMEEHSAHW